MVSPVVQSADSSFQSPYKRLGSSHLAANTDTLSFRKMCSGTWNTKKQCSSPVVFIRQQQKKPHVSVMTLRRKRLRLIRRRNRRDAGADMAMLNLKLHLENRRITAENERLRERASALRRENLALRANLCKTAAEVAPGC